MENQEGVHRKKGPCLLESLQMGRQEGGDASRWAREVGGDLHPGGLCGGAGGPGGVQTRGAAPRAWFPPLGDHEPE